MDREHLEALRRQVEEDYKLDIAAIERLQRRFQDLSSSIPRNGAPGKSEPLGSYSSTSEWSSLERVAPPSSAVAPPVPSERPNDELVGSLRSVFNNNRK